MYLHIGNSFTIRTRDIIGIFDFDTATVEKTTSEMLKKAQDEGNLINTWEEFPKSFVLINDRGEVKIFVSDLSSQSLIGRTEKII